MVAEGEHYVLIGNRFYLHEHYLCAVNTVFLGRLEKLPQDITARTAIRAVQALIDKKAYASVMSEAVGLLLSDQDGIECSDFQSRGGVLVAAFPEPT